MDKMFLLNCKKCKWFRRSTGISSDLADLKEIVKCTNCGGPRSFRCPECGATVKMFRTKKGSTDGDSNS